MRDLGEGLASLAGGVSLARFAGFDGEGQPLVLSSLSVEPLPARSLVGLAAATEGDEVAIAWLDDDRTAPLILGLVNPPVAVAEVDGDAKHVIEGREQVVIRCGKASIVMKKDGHITIRGTYLVSHASAANRIRGGSVNLN